MPLTSPLVLPGDLVVHMESAEYCTVTAIIRNHAATPVTLENIVGWPLKAGTNGADYNLAVAGDEASVIALLLSGPAGQASEALAATTNSPTRWRVLKRAPAIINQNKIRTTDGAAAAFTVATIVTALKALGFEIRTEPLKSTTL